MYLFRSICMYFSIDNCFWWCGIYRDESLVIRSVELQKPSSEWCCGPSVNNRLCYSFSEAYLSFHQILIEQFIFCLVKYCNSAPSLYVVWCLLIWIYAAAWTDWQQNFSHFKVKISNLFSSLVARQSSEGGCGKKSLCIAWFGNQILLFRDLCGLCAMLSAPWTIFMSSYSY